MPDMTASTLSLHRDLGLSRLAAVDHFCSSRSGGSSAGPFRSLNLGLHVGDDASAVLANRRRLAAALSLPAERLVFADQVHGARVARVDAPDAGRGLADHDDAISGTDALITDQPDLCLCILVADCAPILFVDPERRAIGAAHAGWRGAAADIAGATVVRMGDDFGCDPSGMWAWIGPCIGLEDFEVGPEVTAAFREALPDPVDQEAVILPGAGDRSFLDLAEAIARQLQRSGLQRERIARYQGSTASELGRFYSHRAEGGRTGRFAAGIWLRSEASSGEEPFESSSQSYDSSD